MAIRDTILRMFALRQLREKNGLLYILDQVAVWLPASSILQLQSDLSDRFGHKAAREIIVDFARKRTRRGTQKLSLLRGINLAFEKFHAGHPVVDLGSQFWQLGGWGDFTVMRYDARKVVIKTHNSALAQAQIETFGFSKEPVCDYAWGMIAGVLEQLYGVRYRGGETSCRATGRSKECVFEYTPTKRKA